MTILRVLKSKSKNLNSKEYLENNKLTTFINPFSYLFFRKQLPLFSRFDIIFLDGILMVLLMRLISKNVKRLSFDMTSIAPKVFINAIENKRTIFFLGSKQDEIEAFVSQIKNIYQNLNIVGFSSGYFADEDDKQKKLNNIIELNPDLIIVGMGTPLQEEILLEIRDKGWGGTGFTCGGFFHQTGKKINYYPKIFNTLNLRWVYRIYDEPKLFKRYFIQYPKSIVFFTFDLIKYYVK
ncbi:MAG: WecB/TagA/CpsF family glycosyltransferase [bacterium]